MPTVVVILSILSMFACPYNCTVKLASAQSMDGGSIVTCCERCRARETTERSNNETPPSPASDEDGRWCLCGGVVFSVTARVSAEDTLQASLGSWGSDTSELPAIATHLPSVDRTPLPPLLDGRMRRIVLHSLLF